MGGGLIQLVAYGAQDLYLTGNPQITFFKVVYRRHTNFAIESRRLVFNGTPNFETTSVCNILKGPDLLHKMYLEVEVNSGRIKCDAVTTFKSFRWLNWLGHLLIKKSSFTIGGSEIDKHDGEWYHLLNELSQKSEKAEAYAEMVGNTPNLTQIHTTNKTESHNIINGEESDYNFKLYIPLPFWFTKSPGLSLPIIALNHSDMTVEIEFEKLDNLVWGSSETSTKFRAATGSDIFDTKPKFENAYIYADYIYLDSDERKRFAQSAHEYLIEKLQIGSVQSSPAKDKILYNMNFTHPVKELIWVIKHTKFREDGFTQSRCGKQPFNYTTQFDYTGFTGTPEPYTGCGMVGGRKAQNIWNGMAGVSLPYITDFIEPDLSEKFTNTDSKWMDNKASKIISDIDTDTLKKLGYDRISLYHPNTAATIGSVDPHSSKNVNRFIGNTATIQHPSYTFTGVGDTHSKPYYGNWGAANGNNTRMLDQGKNPVSLAKLVLNGADRTAERDGFYYNVLVPYQYHTSCPAPGINAYSFAFEPEEHQPSGSCNFSRIDNASIEVTLDNDVGLNSGATVEMKTYAISYNILRIMSGLGNVAYAN